MSIVPLPPAINIPPSTSESHITWLATPIHKNFIRRFKKEASYNWEDDQSVVDSLIITPDETILGVKTRAIAKYLDHKKVVNIMLGYEKLSTDPKDYFIKDNDSFYTYLALNADYSCEEEDEEEDT